MFIKKQHIKKTLHVFHKKPLKTNFLCWTRLKTEKTLATVKSQLIKKKLCLLYEKSGNFFQSVSNLSGRTLFAV